MLSNFLRSSPASFFSPASLLQVDIFCCWAVIFFSPAAAAWSAFMADAEWSEIKRVTHAEHGLMVGEIEDRLLVPTDYSPASNFLRAS